MPNIYCSDKTLKSITCRNFYGDVICLDTFASFKCVFFRKQKKKGDEKIGFLFIEKAQKQLEIVIPLGLTYIHKKEKQLKLLIKKNGKSINNNNQTEVQRTIIPLSNNELHK